MFTNALHIPLRPGYTRIAERFLELSNTPHYEATSFMAPEENKLQPVKVVFSHQQPSTIPPRFQSLFLQPAKTLPSVHNAYKYPWNGLDILHHPSSSLLS